MGKLMVAWRWAARAARLIVGIPDYDDYVALCKARHPGEPILTYVEFFRERQNARFSYEGGRFKGCC